MRRVVLLLALSLASYLSFAQSKPSSVALERRVVAAQQSLDSLNMLIAQARDNYANNVDSRERIAKQLTTFEAEALKLRREYDNALTVLNSYEQSLFAQNYRPNALVAEQVTPEDTSSVAVAYPKRANLVANGLFETHLSSTDLRLLRGAQADEQGVVAKMKDYMRIYDKMVSLQLEYERVDTESEAEVVLQKLDSVRNVAGIAEDKFVNQWHQLFDNKVYAYNLMMEKNGNMEVVSNAEQQLSEALMQSEQVVGMYESDAFIEYFYRKQALLGYESKVAEVLELSAAKDSLARVKKSMVKSDYALPKVNIIRRSFIEHEPIKVIKPTIYTSKNPIPHTHIYDYGTVYRIRIGIYTNRPNLSALKGVTPLSYTDKYHGGKYAYFVGGFRSEDEAKEGMEKLVKLGFKAPQMVMWVDGEYISNIPEWKSKNLGYNIEITGVAALSDAVKTHISLRNDKCRFSRVGSAFIVGSFASKADAELVVSEIVAMDANIKAEIKSVK